jgi:hypothetical protein
LQTSINMFVFSILSNWCWTNGRNEQ